MLKIKNNETFSSLNNWKCGQIGTVSKNSFRVLTQATFLLGDGLDYANLTVSFEDSIFDSRHNYARKIYAFF